MENDPVGKIPAGRLASLLHIDEGATGGWLEADLAGILQHQLHTHLIVDDVETLPGTSESVHGEGSESPVSFATLIDNRQPSLAMLRLFQRFAKLSLGATPGPLPREVAAVIYYLSIVLAWLRHGQRISGLTDAQLVEGLRWLCAQPWVTHDLKKIAGEGTASLADRRDERE